MYDNIGAKIKSLATWVFVVEAIASIIGGIFILIDELDLLIGLLLLLLGPVVAYVSTWLLYGFGQLIENSDIIAQEQMLKNYEESERKEKDNLNKIKSNISRYTQESEEMRC